MLLLPLPTGVAGEPFDSEAIPDGQSARARAQRSAEWLVCGGALTTMRALQYCTVPRSSSAPNFLGSPAPVFFRGVRVKEGE